MHLPSIFVQHSLQLPLYRWQAGALDHLYPVVGRRKIAVSSPNGAGKSERIVAGAVLWWLARFPQGRVIVTTRDGRQLEGQVLPAVRRHRARFPTYRWAPREIHTATGGWARFWTTDEPGRAEGWHKLDNTRGPLLIIVDEAKSVEEPIFQALDRCTYNALLLVSSPGAMSGHFYDAFSRHRSAWSCVQAGLSDCPHIPVERIDDIIRTYGADHPFTRSTLHGEFMAAEDMDLYPFNVASLERCRRNAPAWIPSRHGLVAFCDFAKGAGENVLAVRDGNRLTSMEAWREADEMAAAGQWIQRFHKRGLRAGGIWGDIGGSIGKKMCDILAASKWSIGRVNFGQPAGEDQVYLSWASEAWHELAKKVDQCQVILPEDDLLTQQLTARKHVLNNRGKLELESKHELRLRGLDSPDRADAVCGVFAMGIGGVIRRAPVEWDDSLPGMDAG